MEPGIHCILVLLRQIDTFQVIVNGESEELMLAGSGIKKHAWGMQMGMEDRYRFGGIGQVTAWLLVSCDDLAMTWEKTVIAQMPQVVSFP